MPPAERGRLCGECQTVVKDLSSMSEEEARETLGSREAPRLCIRYLYDEQGNVVFAGGRDVSRAQIIPDYNLTARVKRRLAQAALLVAPMVLFEACGGNDGGAYLPELHDAGPGDGGRTPADARTDDQPDDDGDAGDAGDAGDSGDAGDAGTD